tara:strand:- start:1685 stop:2434 length:750 start_codon:yes stop_codon:yes gene_type:complete
MASLTTDMAIVTDSEVITEYSSAATYVLENINGFGENRFLITSTRGSFIFQSKTVPELGNIALEAVKGPMFIAKEFVLNRAEDELIEEYDKILNETDPFTTISAPPTKITEIEIATSSNIKLLRFQFYESKIERLEELYGKGPNHLPFITVPPETQIANEIESQNTIPNTIIPYSSISSLGDPVLEDLSISSEGGILTVSTPVPTETYEDVGGVTSFARGVPEGAGTDASGARGTRTVDGDTASVTRGY